MKKAKLINYLLFPFSIWLALFCILQILFQYNFYTIEETNLFLFDEYWLWSKFNQPGGFALLISKFLIQFFAYPYCGAAITSAILTCFCTQFIWILRKITPNSSFLFYLLPAIPLFLVQLDMHYYLQGSIALMIMLAAFQRYICIGKLSGRLIYAVIAIPCIYYLAGSVSLLFATSVLLWECLNRPAKCYWFLIPAIESVAIAFGSVYLSIVGELRFALLPDMYYQPVLDNIPVVLYYSWLVIPIVLFLGWLWSKRKEISKKRSFIENSIQLILIAAILYIGIDKYGNLRSVKFREINFNTRIENWDHVINLCRGPVNNFLYLMNLNMALAHRGVLADKLFQFDQKGSAGLYPEWNNDYSIAVILSDFHFTVGNMAGALHFAFEGNVASNNESPRMIKRLIQTYLIYGNYPGAERHINMLEKSLVYADWAKSQRKFLYTDEAVESDPLLGLKRNLIIDHNFLYNTENNASILSEIAQKGDIGKAAMEYLGAICLLNKDMQMFEYFLQKFYETEALSVLPLSFQEAALILYESQPEMWSKYKISPGVVSRFQSYKKDFVAARTNQAMRSSIESKYKDTYWYYFMFK